MLRPLLVALTVFVLAAARTSAEELPLDKGHTQGEFVVTHLGLSQVRGTIPLVSGSVNIGPANLPTAATATFDPAGLDTHLAPRDADLRDHFFEVAKYPTIVFVAKSIKGKPDAFTMTGELTMHGVTKSVTLAGKVLGSAVILGRRHVAYTATTTVDRRDFGMTFNPLMDGIGLAGYDVQINIEADAVTPRPPGAPGPPTAAPSP